MQEVMLRWSATFFSVILSVASLPAQEGSTSQVEKPSAELIVEAEETIIKEPALEPGEEALPRMDGNFPGEDNIFGGDLFGDPAGGMRGSSSPRAPRLPSAVPVLEDPLETERKMRIRLDKIKARLAGDPGLVELEQLAETAPTPEDYRAARRAYYALFFAKVRRADSTLQDFADQLEKESLSGLFQTRVTPTWPLREPPRPLPQARLVPPNQYPAEIPPGEQPIPLP